MSVKSNRRRFSQQINRDPLADSLKKYRAKGNGRVHIPGFGKTSVVGKSKKSAKWWALKR